MTEKVKEEEWTLNLSPDYCSTLEPGDEIEVVHVKGIHILTAKWISGEFHRRLITAFGRIQIYYFVTTGSD